MVRVNLPLSFIFALILACAISAARRFNECLTGAETYRTYMKHTRPEQYRAVRSASELDSEESIRKGLSNHRATVK